MSASALPILIASTVVAGLAIAWALLRRRNGRLRGSTPVPIVLLELIERDPDAVILMDSEGCTLHSNRAASDLLGPELAKLDRVIPSLLAERLCDAAGRALSRAEVMEALFPLDLEATVSLGPVQLDRVHWLHVTAVTVPLHRREPAATMLRLHDLSDWQRADEAARERGDTLERGIADRTRELETAVENLRQEIAGRREIERKLRNSEERYKMVSQLSTDLSFAFLIGADGEISWEWITPVVARLTGYELEELAKLDWREVVHPDDVTSITDRAAALLDGELVEIEFRILTKSGEIRWLESHTLAKRDEETGAMRAIGAIRDISDRKLAFEEEHRQELHEQETQRLESLGVLAGGVAHDFNNLLAVIAGNAELAAGELSVPMLLQQRLDRIRSAANYAIALTDQILTYAGRSSLEVSVLDLGAVVTGMLDLLRASVSPKCPIELLPGVDLPAIEGDETQIRQVIMNLVSNACESLGEAGGTITLRTGCMHADVSYLAESYGAANPSEGDYVFIEVADAGPGIDAANHSRVFEPFFSTKFSGRGLGLAAVHGIVQAHHGVIRLDSDPGRETRFRVLLPRSEKPYAAGLLPTPVRKSAADFPVDGLRVLVVDDDEAVRELACEFLERADFEVLTADGGAEALRIFDTRSEEIDVVLLDLSMPDIDGQQTYAEIHRRCPDTHVILVSGYSEEMAAERFAADAEGVEFLAKPYTADDLIERIRHCTAS
ncbi:MAG: response regulator [Deltaproteobacteria bacterium]|nr:response regulator [Deltaproteobacteria bacterium]